MLHKNYVWLAQLVSNFMKPGKKTSWLTNWLNNNKYKYFFCYHRLFYVCIGESQFLHISVPEQNHNRITALLCPHRDTIWNKHLQF